VQEASNKISSYSVGGALRADDPTYVKRAADDQFFEALLRHEFCYVLNSRQMGKSSLKVRTKKRLRESSVACVSIDATAIVSADITEDQWYLGLLSIIQEDLNLEVNLISWWDGLNYLSPVQRFGKFLKSVLLAQVSSSVVIFIDEIDATLDLSFKDGFFAQIRACYNQRPESPEYDRLTFALLGVASPSELIEDKILTPFNIGKSIELEGFTLPETQPLWEGLKTISENPKTDLEEILIWTGGQPFLTQKICNIILIGHKYFPAEAHKKSIEEIIQLNILENWEAEDIPQHIETIRARLFNKEKANLIIPMLGVYQRVLDLGSVPSDDSPEQIELRLTGLVVKREGIVRVYNKIYEQIFNSNWVLSELQKQRPYTEAFTAWLKSGKSDESRLLTGNALEEALDWRKGKSLSSDDEEFITESRMLELRTQLYKQRIQMLEQQIEINEKLENRLGKLLEKQTRLDQLLKKQTESLKQKIIEQIQMVKAISRSMIINILAGATFILGFIFYIYRLNK
jgi:hypothetical protein